MQLDSRWLTTGKVFFRKSFFLKLLLVGLLLIGIVLLLKMSKKITQNHQTTSFIDLSPKNSPTQSQNSWPQDFLSLTIPYLRSRSYQSHLLSSEKIAANSAYTTYLSSYDSDGLKIHALLTEPTGERPAGGWPAVVFVHGYIPPQQYQTQERYEDYVNALAKSGLVVLKIDLRGHGQSEGQASGAYYSSDYVIDVLNAVAALETVDFVNNQKIGLWGHSMAGNIVLRSIAVKPTLPAAVIWAGAGFTYQDLLQYGIQDASYRPPASNSAQQNQRRRLMEVLGQFSLENPFWQQVSPLRYFPEIKTAIQLHHARNDEVVSVEYSRNLHSLLNQAQVPNQLFEYESGGHNISGSNFSVAMNRTIDFFTTTLR